MAVRIYTIYDKVADEYGPVFQAKNDGVARRAFEFEIPAEARKNLKDYELMCLGEFSDGILKGLEGPYVVSEKEKEDA